MYTNFLQGHFRCNYMICDYTLTKYLNLTAWIISEVVTGGTLPKQTTNKTQQTIRLGRKGAFL
jgi:hypothetical protein